MTATKSRVDEERARILAADRGWAETVTDLERFASYLSNDVNFYAPGAPVHRGADAFKRAVTELSKTPGFSLKWTVEKAEVSASGDMGYSTGTYVATFGTTKDKGKYVTIWRKQSDGAWKVAEDIFNSDLLPIPDSGLSQ